MRQDLRNPAVGLAQKAPRHNDCSDSAPVTHVPVIVKASLIGVDLPLAFSAVIVAV
jgi:hypothetical protein